MDQEDMDMVDINIQGLATPIAKLIKNYKLTTNLKY